MAGSDSTLSTTRVLEVSARRLFSAFEDPDCLTQWWGPAGFTNTFEQFEFRPGGRWLFVMHAPNGANYANDSYFREIEPTARIVIDHVVEPWFRLTVTFTPQDTPQGEQTHLAWDQEFASPEMAERMRPLAATANEQVLDRLQALVMSDRRCG